MKLWRWIYIAFIVIAVAALSSMYLSLRDSNNRLDKLTKQTSILAHQNRLAIQRIHAVQAAETQSCRGRHLQTQALLRYERFRLRHSHNKATARSARRTIKSLKKLDCHPEPTVIVKHKTKFHTIRVAVFRNGRTRFERVRVSGPVPKPIIKYRTKTKTIIVRENGTVTVVQTVPGPATTTTVRLPAETRTITSPGHVVTVTEPRHTVTVTIPGRTTTTAATSTVTTTTPGHTVTKPCRSPHCP